MALQSNIDLKIFGQRLRTVREKAGLSLSDLSRQAGLPSSTALSMAEKGIVLELSDKRLKRIAQRCGVSLDYLLGVSDDAKSQEIFDGADNLKAIAGRLREAREDAGLTQEKAAKLMGYANSSRLAKIENGLDMKSIPMNVVIMAADLYGVSIDYLCGRSLYPDHDPHAVAEWSALKHLRADVMKIEEAYLERLKRARVDYSNLAAAIEAVLPVVLSATDRVERFRNLNREIFDDLPGGAPLLRIADELKALFINVKSWSWRAGRGLDGIERVPECDTETAEEAILRLSKLSSWAYERVRKAAADSLDVRAAWLDAQVERCRRNGGGRQEELPFGVESRNNLAQDNDKA